MAIPTKTIAIVGATGQQGGSVLETFLHLHWRVRAITRNASSPKAKALAARSPNIQVVEADLSDLTTLKIAFEGAHVIYGVTDFWASYGDQSNRAKVAEGQTFPEWCQGREIQQGKNIFEAAAAIPTLERLVFSSLAHFSKWSHGKYKNALHFDSKAIVAEWAEEKLPEIWAKTSIIQLGVYLSNFIDVPFFKPEKKDDTYVFSIAGSKSDAWPWVAAEHDTGLIVQALISNPPGKNVVAYRELLSIQDVVNIWGRLLGVKVKLERSLPVGVPEELRLELQDTFDAVEEFGYWAYEDKSVCHPADLRLTLQDLGSVEEYIKAQDWSITLGDEAQKRSFF